MVEIREREQLTEPKISIKSEVRIIGCQVVKDKLITQLDDGREVIIAINLLTKWGVLDKEVQPEQLKNPELHSEGRYIYFPKIDDTLPVRVISEGIFKSSLRKLELLDAVPNLQELRKIPGLDLHPLKDDRKGQHAIKINDQWRICFI
ncbi:1036_t:CDS:2 [Cetraspora pellucida]|uniref:1036_t:CDS:1 n=1 Tax=Cetraspora pellucida TaxID=1433469 RepID=A0ACA9NMJ6_9GLOM|nr:1036_t:CDS:2 [Cetraspora pellucida]